MDYCKILMISVRRLNSQHQIEDFFRKMYLCFCQQEKIFISSQLGFSADDTTIFSVSIASQVRLVDDLQKKEKKKRRPTVCC